MSLKNCSWPWSEKANEQKTRNYFSFVRWNIEIQDVLIIFLDMARPFNNASLPLLTLWGGFEFGTRFMIVSPKKKHFFSQRHLYFEQLSDLFRSRKKFWDKKDFISFITLHKVSFKMMRNTILSRWAEHESHYFCWLTMLVCPCHFKFCLTDVSCRQNCLFWARNASLYFCLHYVSMS